MFMEFLDIVLSQLVGFFLWLIVFPLRLIIGVLDPVFEPITAAIDFTAFLDGIEVLRPFFRDVNYFIPFGAAVGVLGATVVAMFVFVLLKWAIWYGAENFGSFSMHTVFYLVTSIFDKAKGIISGIIKYLFS